MTATLRPMRMCDTLCDVPTGPAFDPEAEVLALCAQTAQLVAVTHALASSRRHVDVEGLQNHVGLLCAKALDLPPTRTGFVKMELTRLVGAVDALSDTLRKNAG